MRSFAKVCLVASLVPTLALAAPAESETPAEGKRDRKEAPSTNEREREDAILAGIPANETYQGLRIPDFDEKGKMRRLFEAKSARRIGERDFAFEDLKIEIHNEDGSTFHVEMAKSVFNLDTRILKSETPAQIRRDDFVIDGESAEFHLSKKFGRMIGPTKMVIFNTDQQQ